MNHVFSITMAILLLVSAGGLSLLFGDWSMLIVLPAAVMLVCEMMLSRQREKNQG